MNTPEVMQVGTKPQSMARSGFQPSAELPRGEVPASAPPDETKLGPRRSGYGMPCAKCRTYYAADLQVCPVCQSTERVSPRLNAEPRENSPAESFADPSLVEQERERFLREFQSQLQISPVQVNTSAAYSCNQEQNHPGGLALAAVCQACYDHLQERVDLMEAALHMDVKEAAQVVYDAVWADPSDPSRTYQNAAQSLLAELRRRAGVKLALGSLQPLPD